MASLEAQLKNVKLRKTTDIKDFSDPKLAGFTSKEEISQYQLAVLDVNTERWEHILAEFTFPTCYCAIAFEHAQLFIKIYEQNFKDKDPEIFSEISWRKCLSGDEIIQMESLEESLANAIHNFDKSTAGVFVKTSSRSAKDAPMYQQLFKDHFQGELHLYSEDERKEENVQITCLLVAAFKSMRMTTAKQVLDLFVTSERIYQDMLLAVEQKSRFHENFVIRQFVDIDVDMEFRGFVYGYELNALSQYNYLIYSDRLRLMKNEIHDVIRQFYLYKILPRLVKEDFVSNFVIDFAVCRNKDDSWKIWVIELNPFLETTDGALFSWQHERDILEGRRNSKETETKSIDPNCMVQTCEATKKENTTEEADLKSSKEVHKSSENDFTNQTEYRITEKPKPGAKTMLPIAIRKLLDNTSK